VTKAVAKTGKPRTRRERVEAREGAIIAAARTLFAERDFDDVPVGEIAERAGVAEGTVYLYFESKAALLHAVVVVFYEQLTEQAAAGVRSIRDTRKRLEFLAVHHVESVIEHRRILFGVDRRGTDGSDDQYRLNRTYVAVFDDAIREGVDRGDVRSDVPLWLLRDMFYGSLEYAARTTMIHARVKDVRRAVRTFLDAFEQGVLVSGESKSAASPGMEDVARRLERVAARLEESATAKRRTS
jgi:TetR/AcrR family fatty acid metabolism transcriptional regulator